MLSHDLANIEKLFALASTGVVKPPQKVMHVALHMLRDCKEQALQLEACVVPRRQRLQQHHLEDGTVVIFPMVAAPEAEL